MSTREARQDKDPSRDYSKLPVEKQKEESRRKIQEEEQDEVPHEELAKKAARELDEKRSDPRHFDDFSGTL